MGVMHCDCNHYTIKIVIKLAIGGMCSSPSRYYGSTMICNTGNNSIVGMCSIS